MISTIVTDAVGTIVDYHVQALDAEVSAGWGSTLHSFGQLSDLFFLPHCKLYGYMSIHLTYNNVHVTSVKSPCPMVATWTCRIALCVITCCIYIVPSTTLCARLRLYFCM